MANHRIVVTLKLQYNYIAFYCSERFVLEWARIFRALVLMHWMDMKRQ